MQQGIRPLIAALNSSGKYGFKSPEITVDHLVVGAGVVGLATAQRLCERFPAKSTYVVERHGRAGEETSSRNSEVIHSGLYYPPNSLKTQLCIRGRDLIYERCRTHDVPHRRTGKLVVAHADQVPYIQNLHNKSKSLQGPAYAPSNDPVLPTKLISGDEARDMEPSLSKEIFAALWVPQTGIVDSHTLMESLEKDIMESEGGELAYATSVVRVDPASNEDGSFVVQLLTEGQTDAILAKTLINTSGLSAPFILNSLLPEDKRIPIWYARGSYASYRGPGVRGIKHLIYPCPDTKAGVGFASLGTHLTLDLNGKIRFGPDLEWISPPSETEEENVDFWRHHLVPSDERIPEMHRAVTSYLPDVTLEGMSPDYVGIRPKLVGPGEGFQDFVIRRDGRMVTLLGIESPGLTSSMAIAEHVVDRMLPLDNLM
ncbi:nad dehydrogenase [Moniliophthora roreri MCA 2997]|uniref:L-2-hydroxyglutarate dehydrogenase, mitochondrial n=1 Tax=Moniliophthora roreri (strain MCA 2997) TaxID=1381753 RepID=V2XJ51_MONRO|nr:nad dehydrogenase [Moniliophthora roreri MCA 2997]KAI3596683.1 nad dehydrogenase [Moniliophthora roreri]